MDKLTLKGHGYFERRTKDGKMIDSWETDNLIVTTGKERVSKLIGNVSSTYFRAIGIGTGETGAVIGNTVLEVEVARAGASIAYEASNKCVFEHTFTFNSAEAFNITEAGIFDQNTIGGVMLDRFVFSAKAVDVDTDLYVQIKITVA